MLLIIYKDLESTYNSSSSLFIVLMFVLNYLRIRNSILYAWHCERSERRPGGDLHSCCQRPMRSFIDVYSIHNILRWGSLTGWMWWYSWCSGCLSLGGGICLPLAPYSNGLPCKYLTINNNIPLPWLWSKGNRIRRCSRADHGGPLSRSRGECRGNPEGLGTSRCTCLPFIFVSYFIL